MVMCAVCVRRPFARMAVDMHMHRAVGVAMRVDMHPVPPQAIEDMPPEKNQHDANDQFNTHREAGADGRLEQHRGTAHQA